MVIEKQLVFSNYMWQVSQEVRDQYDDWQADAECGNDSYHNFSLKAEDEWDDGTNYPVLADYFRTLIQETFPGEPLPDTILIKRVLVRSECHQMLCL